MICSCFGHKDTPSEIYPRLVDCIEDLIQNRGICDFMVGNQGRFDGFVLKALRELKQRYPLICYHVVLAYMPGEQRENDERYCPSETFLPEGIEAVPKRFAISWRNRWMVRDSDVIVCFISHSWGGAAQFADYAQKQGKEVINLAKQ